MPDDVGARAAEVLEAEWQLAPSDAIHVRKVHEVTTVVVEGLYPDASYENAWFEPATEVVVVGDEAAGRCVRSARIYGEPVAVAGYRDGRLAAVPAKALPAVSLAAERVRDCHPQPSAVQLTVFRESVARVSTGKGATAWLGLRSGRVLWAHDPALEGHAASRWAVVLRWALAILIVGMMLPISAPVALILAAGLAVAHRVVARRHALPPDAG